MTPDEYRALGRHIWRSYVPPRGQSATVQGELLRAQAKLRDEAQRNGNVNWDEGHVLLASYVLETITADPGVPPTAKVQLRADVARLCVADDPYTDDDLFDRVERVILDWCAAHPDPVPHAPNPTLRR